MNKILKIYPTLQTTPLSEIPVVPLRWLWYPVIPLGKITMLVGYPGVSKSTVTTDIAARLSAGARWPDGVACEAADVLLLSAEDDPADTIRPRLEAAGANCSRIHFADAMTFEDEYSAIFREAFTDLVELEAVRAGLHELSQAGHPVRLLIVDPISAYLGALDSHKAGEVRAMLAPLAALAQEWQVAVVLVSHYNKGNGGSAISRISGSVAFGAAARSVWTVIRDEEESDRRLFLPVKANLAPDTQGFAYRIVTGTVPRLEWEAVRVDTPVDEILDAGNGEERGAVADAAEFLHEMLRDGPQSVSDIEQEARGQGISAPSLRRAKKRLGLIAEKAFGSGKWRWRLPDQQGDQHLSIQKVDRIDHIDRDEGGRRSRRSR